MKFKKPTKNLLILFFSLTVIILAASVLYMWNTDFGGLPTGYLGLIAAATPAYAIYLLSKNKRLNPFFFGWTIVVCALTFLALAIFPLSYLAGTCIGFFGVVESCAEAAKLRIFFLFYNPFVVFSSSLLSVLALLAQTTRKA